jgi:hypothetical protein
VTPHEQRLGFNIAFCAVYLLACMPVAAVLTIGTFASHGELPLRGILYGGLLAVGPLAGYRRLRWALLDKRARR